MCPRGRKLIAGAGGLFERAHLPCHVLLIESDAGLILLDTGFGTADLASPSRLPASFRLPNAVNMDPAQTATAQIKALGYSPSEVSHIVLTHLDLDHAGGLSDFPQATVHLHLREQQAAQARRTFIERQRYLPAHWSHAVRWQTHAPVGEHWQGFAGARVIDAIGDALLLIPLHGHTHGHSGVAVQGKAGWMLHAGDAYFHHAEIKGGNPPGGLMAYERLIAMDNRLRLENQARLRALNDVDIFCSHDPAELARLQSG